MRHIVTHNETRLVQFPDGAYFATPQGSDLTMAALACVALTDREKLTLHPNVLPWAFGELNVELTLVLSTEIYYIKRQVIGDIAEFYVENPELKTFHITVADVMSIMDKRPNSPEHPVTEQVLGHLRHSH